MEKKYFIFFLLIFYFFFQLSSIDYGTKINDINYIKNSNLDEDAIKNFIQKKQTIKQTNTENNKKWVYRYKLYSVNADEMMGILALSKIDIKNNIFDPHLYKYGGAFIYPLGLYYYSLIKLNLIENIEIGSIVKNGDLIDKIYTQGRFFVLLSFIFSAFILYKSLNLITTKNYSLIFTMIYLFAPSSIMFSQIIKPNWYALLWFNLSIFFGLKYLLKEKKKYFLLLVSIFLGLAIGSSILFIPSLFFIFFFIYFNKNEKIPKKNIIILVAISFLVFLITNPYILINSSNFLMESRNEYGWVLKNINYKNIIFFFNNSFIQGFGIIFSLCFFYYLLISFKKSSEKKIGLGLILLLLFGSILGSFDNWHIQFRYIPYILPISLLFLAYKLKDDEELLIFRGIKIDYKLKTEKLLIFIFITTFIQTLPLKIAYFDENNLNHSTRLNSAKWLNENIIDKGMSLCQKDFVPYDYPPINFDKVIIKKECDYNVHVLRQPKEVGKYPIITGDLKNVETIIKRFPPRFQFIKFPLVFSHINPLIIVTMK